MCDAEKPVESTFRYSNSSNELEYPGSVATNHLNQTCDRRIMKNFCIAFKITKKLNTNLIYMLKLLQPKTNHEGGISKCIPAYIFSIGSG